MQAKPKAIPVNSILEKFGSDIFISNVSARDLEFYNEVERAHRDNYHLFFIQEQGDVLFEVDFKTYQTVSPCLMYIHPNQVHRSRGGQNVCGIFLAIGSENLNTEYLNVLTDIAPVQPLELTPEAYTTIAEAISLCLKFSERTDRRFYHTLLKDSCNVLAGLIISQYLVRAQPVSQLSRFETITKAFKKLLETNFVTMKRPADYAQQLHLSTPYLNECVKNVTGFPVTWHIRERILLEAKRLLFHSDEPVKVIASKLGYDDYPYFSRLFTKATGISALTFRRKNRD